MPFSGPASARAMPRVGLLVVFAMLLIPLAVPSALSAPVTRSCELVPHGALMGVGECSVSAFAASSIQAVVSVTVGTVDAIEIEMRDPAGSRHVFLCEYHSVGAVCFFPVQVTNAMDGTWTVTARVVAADPLGPVLYGGVDTYARLDATFE